MKKVTAGRDALGDFAPKFAELNDDVLFGEVWSREDKLPARDRSIVTYGKQCSGQFSCLSYRRGKKERCYKRRNGRNFDTCCLLCWLA